MNNLINTTLIENTRTRAVQTIGAGLEAWVVIAKAVRIATRNGMKYPPLTTNGMIIDTQQATAYYTGAIGLVAILILTLVFTFLGAIGQCFALTCCLNRIRTKRRTESSFFQKVCALSWLLFVYVFFMVGALTTFTGGNALAGAIYNIQDTTVGTLSSTLRTVGNLSPAINTTFDNLGRIVNTAIDTTINSVNFQQLSDLGVLTNLQSLATAMRNTNTNKNNLWTSGLTFKTSMDNANANLITLVTNIQAVTATVSSWGNPPGIALNGGSWQLTSPTIDMGTLNAQATACQTNFAACPDGTAQLGPVNAMPNLVTFANEIDVLVGKLTVDVRNMIVSSSNSTKNSTIMALQSARSGITTSLTSMSGDLESSINPLITQINDVFAVVRYYEQNRAIAMIVFSSLILFILVVFGYFFKVKKPAGVKGCNLISTPIYLMIQLIAIVLCILAIGLGDVCSAVFQYSPPPILQALDVNTGRVVTQAFSFRDQCVANVSLITIAGDLGFVNQTQVNVTKLAFDQIDVVDFSSLTSSFNLSQSLSLSNSPTAQLNNLLNLNTSELSASGFDTLNSSLAGVITTLNTLKTSMATARAATAPTKVFTLSGGVTFGQADADFIARSTAIDTTIDSIIASIETFRTTTISNLKTSIDGLRTSADGLKTNALTVPTYYDAAMVGITTFSTNASNNLTNVIPVVKNYIKTQIPNEQVLLNRNLNCTDLGNSVIALQDGVCTRLMEGLDSVWFSYAVLGITAFISMPAMIYVANTLLAFTFGETQGKGYEVV